MNFAIRLKTLREKNNLSQKQLAIDLGVSFGTVGMWESAKRVPKAARLKQIANFFNVSMDYLLGLGDELGGSSSDYGALQLSAEERKLLENFRALPAAGKKLVKTTVEAFLETNADERRGTKGNEGRA